MIWSDCIQEMREDMPKVSVIMGIYNETNKKQVKEAVDSVLGQSFSDFEFLIYDDGSKDENYKWLEEYCREDARIHFSHNPKNRGLSAVLNDCMKQAEGEYIARMDADDISERERFARQVAFLDSHQDYAWVGCHAKLIGESEVWGQREVTEIPVNTDFLQTSPFIHPTVMFRTEILRQAGGYSEEPMAQRVEDYELFMRLYADGWQGYNIQQYLFYYRESRDSFQKRKYRYRINECRVRYRGFGGMGIRKGNFRYVLKPLLVGLVPAWLNQKLRGRKFSGHRKK